MSTESKKYIIPSRRNSGSFKDYKNNKEDRWNDFRKGKNDDNDKWITLNKRYNDNELWYKNKSDIVVTVNRDIVKNVDCISENSAYYFKTVDLISEFYESFNKINRYIENGKFAYMIILNRLGSNFNNNNVMKIIKESSLENMLLIIEKNYSCYCKEKENCDKIFADITRYSNSLKKPAQILFEMLGIGMLFVKQEKSQWLPFNADFTINIEGMDNKMITENEYCEIMDKIKKVETEYTKLCNIDDIDKIKNIVSYCYSNM